MCVFMCWFCVLWLFFLMLVILCVLILLMMGLVLMCGVGMFKGEGVGMVVVMDCV